MKTVVALVAVVLTTFIGLGQIEVLNIQKIDRSTQNSYSNVVETKNGIEFYNIGRKTVYINTFDKNSLSEKETTTIEVPEKAFLMGHFLDLEETPYVFGVSAEKVLSIFKLDIENRKIILKSETNLSEYSSFLEKSYTPEVVVNNDNEILVLFYEESTVGTSMNASYLQWENLNAIKLKSDWKTIEGSFNIPHPTTIRTSNFMGIDSYDECEFLDNNRILITNYEKSTFGGTVKSKKIIFEINGDDLSLIWTNLSSDVSGISEESGNIYLNKNGEIERIVPTFKDGQLKISKYQLEEGADDLQEIFSYKSKNVDARFNKGLFVVSNEKSNPNSYHIIVDISKTHMLNLTVENNAVTKEFETEKPAIKWAQFIPQGMVDEKVIFDGYILALNNGNFEYTPIKKVFKKTMPRSGKTINYIVNGKIYTSRSEYSIANMKTQFGVWK